MMRYVLVTLCAGAFYGFTSLADGYRKRLEVEELENLLNKLEEERTSHNALGDAKNETLDEMMSEVKAERKDVNAQLRSMRKFFYDLDKNGDGFLDKNELSSEMLRYLRTMADAGATAAKQDEAMAIRGAFESMILYDEKGNSTLDLTGFVWYIGRLMYAEDTLDLANVVSEDMLRTISDMQKVITHESEPAAPQKPASASPSEADEDEAEDDKGPEDPAGASPSEADEDEAEDDKGPEAFEKGFNELDKNDDGYLDKDESKNKFTGGEQEFIDTDNDGKMSLDEAKKAANKELTEDQVVEGTFQMGDTSNDGFIDDKESRALFGNGSDYREAWNETDKNNDRKMSLDEFKKAYQEEQEAAQQKSSSESPSEANEHDDGDDAGEEDEGEEDGDER
eukprot:TRINITY_DN460_c0_g1_i1.p1 TRINITY_DN460_c0_g1~~TRINITY_DN460_c0_g1_i1.p1  ORF type:complete len:395 (-),score=113.77 TRINITY_DN460_c0_g1_i1:347-1531(-)